METLLGGAPSRSRSSTSARPSRGLRLARRIFLFGSSYYTGVSTVPLRDRPSEIKAITNAETGYFRPILPDGMLLALEYLEPASSRPSSRSSPGGPERHHLRADRQQASCGEVLERGL
jgi:hypothetical protein